MPETPGITLTEALSRLEAEGYTAQMGAAEGGRVMCFTCHESHPATDLAITDLIRIEGVSDPDDMAAVAGVTCTCGAKGTLVLKYGPDASPEEVAVLKLLEDHRRD